MNSPNKQKDLLKHLIPKSKEELIAEFSSYDEATARDVCVAIFAELKNAVIISNIDKLCIFRKLIDSINKANNDVKLQTCYNHSELKNTNLVILACKHNAQKSLQYLLNNCDFLKNIHRTLSPRDEDEVHHNAFYYALRLDNVKILQILIDEWHGINSEELDEVVSLAYEELKLKNVALSNQVETFIEETLINLRFYSDDSNDRKTVTIVNINERIDLVLENIDLINLEYLDEEVDEIFLYRVKFIAKNIHILKRYLKATYDRLPWEEFEFCLVSFIRSSTEGEGILLLFKSVLKKENVLSHSRNFALVLNNVKVSLENSDVVELRILPKISRDKNIEAILRNYPQFQELYNDYSSIIDFYSLNQIKYYTDLSLTADSTKREERFIIIRALQVIGEYVKNTLESPKLSSITGKLLLQSLQNNTMQIAKQLRNLLSHTYSLSKQIDLEANQDISFFTNIQDDIKKINIVITGILYNIKLNRVRILLNNVINSSSINEIKDTTEALRGVNFDGMIFETKTSEDYSELELLIEKLIGKIPDKTSNEIQHFNEIQKIIGVEKTKLKSIKDNYFHGLTILKSYVYKELDDKVDSNEIRVMKFYARKGLESISLKIELENFKAITMLLKLIASGVMSRMKIEDKLMTSSTDDDSIEEGFDVMIFFNKVIHFIEFEMDNIKWVEELRSKLKGNSEDFTIDCTPRNESIVPENELALKLSLLENILNQYSGGLLSKKNQIILEMLLLDIMSILDYKNCLNLNLLYLDNNFPVLIGKNLRNHLAHGNALIDILSLNPETTMLANVSRLIEDNRIKNTRKIGKIISHDSLKLRKMHDQNIRAIIYQRKMFTAIAEGNFNEVKCCIENGADIRARTCNLWTAWHFAAKQFNLEIVKYLLEQNLDIDTKNMKQQSALHIAAIYGSKDFIQFFIENKKIDIDVADYTGKTLLHYAAQNGHKEVIELLYKNKARTTIKDFQGNSPLHYAVNSGHTDAAKILFRKEQHVDSNQTMGGYTSLHIAAERGHLDIVNFLLDNNTNVNSKNDNGGIPLHTAALNGHLDTVNALILKGSDVNSRMEDGCTSLHYAVERNHEGIVQLLIKHGADVNVVDKLFRNTPLIYAATDGYKGIVEILLKNKADVNKRNINHQTPLHLAASSGHLDIVILLLRNKAEIKKQDMNGCTALQLSAYNGHIGVLKFLAKQRFNLDARDKNKQTSLHGAAANGHKEVVEFLLSKGADVNSMEGNGCTALHFCSLNGHGSIAKMLIEKGAEINARNNFKLTPLQEAIKINSVSVVEILLEAGVNVNSKQCDLPPLHFAAFWGHKEIVEILLNKNIRINDKTKDGSTPLHAAVQNNKLEVTKLLIQSGCDIDAKSFKENETSLCLAVRNNNKEIVDVLLASGADVNVENGKPLHLAIYSGHKNIITELLRHKKLKLKTFNWTFLHTAAIKGDISTVKALLKRGIEVDTLSGCEAKITPLFSAVLKNHTEVVEALLASGANANVLFGGDTPLHRAVGIDVVNLLLNSGANPNIKDQKKRLPIELAVANGRLDIVKVLLKYSNVHIIVNVDWTLLHIAAQEDHLEVAKFLIEKGANIHARNLKGTKPIHVAAREGSKKVLQYLFDKTTALTDYGAAFQNILHYAALGGQLEIVKYLMDKNFDINKPDARGSTALHLAAEYGYIQVVKTLLNNGANYKSIDAFNKKPVQKTSDKEVIKLLTAMENLYKAVKSDNLLDVENSIREGAVVSAKDSDNATPLHYASCKGFGRVVDVLLKHQADPNVFVKNGFTPLHYSVHFGHFEIVQKLLSYGAIHDVKTDTNKIPLDLAKRQDTIDLLTLVAESFKNVRNGDCKVINDLNKVKDIDTIKAVMNARNKENKTIIVTAIQNDFPKIKLLKEIFQDSEESAYIAKAKNMQAQENFQGALNIYKIILEKRRRILGSDDPAILDIQYIIALMLYKQQKYANALKLFKEIYEEQQKILGITNKDTLNTRSKIALALHRLGKEEEALVIYKEVSVKQINLLGPNDVAVLETYNHMALVLDKLGRYEEALKINYENYEKYKEIYGVNHPLTLISRNNIAMVLNNQGNHDQAFKIFKNVFETRTIIFGLNHSDTLRALQNMVTVLSTQQKFDEALALYTSVYDLQKSALGVCHIDTIRTNLNMAEIYFQQGKLTSALKIYKESLEEATRILGSKHPIISNILSKLAVVKEKFKLQGPEGLKMFEYLKADINTVAANGDKNLMETLIINGADVNTKDSEGRTLLHFAASNKSVDITLVLLENGADVVCNANNGNTPLHCAASKGCQKWGPPNY